MTTFKRVATIDNQPRVILQPVELTNGVIVGRIFMSGPFGCLPATDEEGGHEFPMLESLDKAADSAGPKGTVYVYDPSDLWASEWPALTK